MEKLLKKYEELCAIPYVKGVEPYSDISYHLPKLKEYAEKCRVVVELGTRRGESTVAFLAGKPVTMFSFDLVKWDNVNEIEEMAKEAGIDFRFSVGNSLEINIPLCDLLFIDTFHTATQLERELERHHKMVTGRIIMHDTAPDAFGEVGEPSYEAVSDLGVNCGRGLKYAIEPFLQEHPEWVVDYISTENNGLTVLRRIK